MTAPVAMSQTALAMNPITVSIPITRTMCESILSTAIEGGINYWASVTATWFTDDPEARLPKIMEAAPRDGRILYWAAKVVDEVMEDGKALHNIDYSVIRTGLERMLTLDHKTGQYPLGSVSAREYFWQDFGEYIMNGGAREGAIFGGQMDAPACDVVVQLGLFGEVVYG